jgi:ParB/RepB/Spo0J family partition protein
MKKNSAPTYKTLPLALIDDPEHALRVEMDDDRLLELERDIRANGLYYPLIVRAVDERYEVIDGHRRLIACRRAGIEYVPCSIQGPTAPPPEAVKLKTNLLREDNTDAEIAVWLGELAQRHEYSLEQLAATVGRSEAWVNERTDLLRGDANVLQALGERKINFSQAKVLNRCKSDQWRALGLYHAIVDQIPAVRLNEWINRNLPQIDAATPSESGTAIPAPLPPQGPLGISCEFCGGWKDPQNMIQLWLHRWEWDMVKQILTMRQQEMEQANQPATQ